MPRPFLLLLVLLLAGCGGLSPMLDATGVDPVRGETLVVYVDGTPDLRDADDFRDQLGDGLGASFRSELAAALSERVAFDEVVVEETPPALVLEDASYRVVSRNRANRSIRSLASARIPASGTPVAGGGDYVVFLSDVSAGRSTMMDTVAPGVNTVDVYWTLSADALLWDNAAAEPLIAGRARGAVEIGSGFSRGTVDEATWTSAIDALAGEIVRGVRLAERD